MARCDGREVLITPVVQREPMSAVAENCAFGQSVKRRCLRYCQMMGRLRSPQKVNEMAHAMEAGRRDASAAGIQMALARTAPVAIEGPAPCVRLKLANGP